MVNIVISGVPKNYKHTKLLMQVKDYKGFGFAKQLYWKPLNGNMKQIILSMRADDGYRLLRALDGFVLKYNGEDYPLSCWQDDINISTEMRPRLSLTSGGSEERLSRDRSPLSIRHTFEPEIQNQENHMDDEIRALDLKIELVKKQRILIEEEAKLHLEQQKLDILKSLGPFDHEKLEKFERIKDLNDPEQLAELAKPRVMAEKPEPKVKFGKKKKSPIIGPLKTILSDMSGLIKQNLTYKNRRVLRPMVRTILKQRIKENFKNELRLTPEEFLNVYRSKYPKSTDEVLLEEVNTRISDTHMLVKVDWGRELANTKAGDGNVTSVMDPAEVGDIVDMEDDLDDWIEDEKPEINGENGVARKEENVATVAEAKNDVAVAEETDKVKDEAPKEVKEEDKISEDAVNVEEAKNDVAVAEEADKVKDEAPKEVKEEDKISKDAVNVGEAKNDVAIAEEADKVLKDEDHKEVKEDKISEDAVIVDNDVIIVDDKKVNEVIIVDKMEQ